MALLGATQRTLTVLPHNKPVHPSILMIHWNTWVMVSAPLLPTIKCVRIISSNATKVLDTAPRWHH
jgi:hypothetical protein